uniref:J domain-containing protein n=1 Tax=Rhodnius prolixus TaxID=13249 RepID=T1HV01_RHOPR
MLPLSDNEDLICFLVTKHSTWKGKYKRIFSFGTNGITTYDPDSLAVTNRWCYSDVATIKRTDKGTKFTFAARKDKTRKVESLVFSTELRSDLLTTASMYSHLFLEKPLDQIQRYEVKKLHWSGTYLPALLDVGYTSLSQLDIATGHTLATYNFKDIDNILDVTDNNQAFIVSMKPFGRLHMFICPSKEEIKRKVEENAQYYLGIEIIMQNKPISTQQFSTNKFGTYSGDEHTTSLTEFRIEKFAPTRHGDSSIPRLLCITETCIVERDLETYDIVTIRPLKSVLSLVRIPIDQRQFIIEYIDCNSRIYFGSNRDSILATLLDGVRSSGNRDVHVKMKRTCRGKRLGPYYVKLEVEAEAALLKLLKNSAGKKLMSDTIERFNCNVPYSGLLHSVTQDGLFKDNKEKPIIEALQVIIARTKDTYSVDTLCEEELEALYHTIRRLVASKVGFCAFTQVSGTPRRFPKTLSQLIPTSNGQIKRRASIKCALALVPERIFHNESHKMNFPGKLSQIKDTALSMISFKSHFGVMYGLINCITIIKIKYNMGIPCKRKLLTGSATLLSYLFYEHVVNLSFILQDPCITIVKGASLVMRAIIEEGDTDWSRTMQEMSLNESALPRHLVTALFSKQTDRNLLAQRHLSRQLVSLFLTDNPDGIALMQRIIPVGLLNYLNSTDVAPSTGEDPEWTIRDNLKLAQDHASKYQKQPQLLNWEKQYRLIEKHLEFYIYAYILLLSKVVKFTCEFRKLWSTGGAHLCLEKRQDKSKVAPVVLRKGRKVENPIKQIAIRKSRTRDELKNALEKEIRQFEASCEVSQGANLAWNHAEFEVNYASLKDQLCIDGYYIKVLLDKQEAPKSLNSISNNFFNNLYHRFLLPTSMEMKCMCLQAMALVYGSYHDKIGCFSDTKYIVNLLERTCDKLERDRLLIFLHKLTLAKDNVKEIVNEANGVPYLVDLMTLAHLHTTRAIIPTQSNLLEFGADCDREDENEWHYSISAEDNSKRNQPVSFKKLKELFITGVINAKSKCWAQGMLNWKPLQMIPQLKWCLLSKDKGIMNESDMTILILNMFINMMSFYPSRNKEHAIISPMSRIKTILSCPTCLHHIVQLLLTFDPIIVEKVATLLCLIAEDNPITSQLYTTGVFYFILMYNGSNLLPIAKFLKITHTLQAFTRDENASSSLMQRSILGQLLPEAMVNYLENYGAEKFAQIFLGEYDTPEAIWNSEMRCMLIQKIAAHIADFTPRLWSNNRAQYQYIVIPAVRYPQLQNELFCNIYYLRHLCDTIRFPNWPVADPVGLLRDVLEAWTSEVEKKPPAMSVDEAYSGLGLKTGKTHDEPTIRKAYYKLAQLYHPDKNPDGRVKFEAVNKAYDFLCSRSSWHGNSINTNNIILILQTQSILFHRYSNELRPYKYAGYKQLTRTIQLETNDEQLFSKQVTLLSSAIELVYHTIKCSSLNAEEFNREHGFQIISAAYSRCVSVLSESTKESETIVKICYYCTNIFKIAAQFGDCLQTFIGLPNLVPDTIRILHFKNLIVLRCAVVECISALTVDTELQLSFLQAGVLWYLISFLFIYDFTLGESGIESSKEHNQQAQNNQLAKLSVTACGHLGGYLNGNCTSPHNQRVRQVLETLLTSYLASMLANEDPHEVLKTLTSNCSNPYLVWDNTTRTELMDWLEERRLTRYLDEQFDQIEFSFTVHSKHLIIGGIFIALYNEQPLYTIQNPKQFVLDILDFLRSKEPSRKILTKQDHAYVLMALESLYNVISNNQSKLLPSLKGRFIILSSVANDDMKTWILSTIKLASRTQECIEDIAANNMMMPLLLSLYDLPASKMLILDCIHALITSSNIVKQLLSRGGVLYLLDTVLNGNTEESRLRAVEVLARLMQDKVSGRKISLIIGHILPPALPDAILDSPKAALNLLATDHDNPEIIWKEEDRINIKRIVGDHVKKQYLQQKENPDIPVEMPDIATKNRNEIIVGGVYLRLYNANPSWSVRKPVLFLTDLLDTFLRLNNKFQEELVDAVGTALINLISFNPKLAEQLPSLGHLPKLFTEWNVNNLKISNHVFQFLKLIFANEMCVSSLCQIECMGPIKQAIIAHTELLSVASDALSKMFEFKNDGLVKQALDVNIIKYLLAMLEETTSARTKALIVKTLKLMSQNSTIVMNLLENSHLWSNYSEQNHDLFITMTPSVPYITGGSTAAGYLTEGQNQPMPSVPPPLELE